MKFQFKFEVLKKHRRRLEEEAQRNFMEARANLDACLNMIKSHYDSIEDSRSRIANEQSSGNAHAFELIRGFEQFIDGQKIRIERKRQEARHLMVVVEEKQELLIEAAREYKKIEKLRERKLEDFKKHKKRVEAKRVDDLVTIRTGRKEIK